MIDIDKIVGRCLTSDSYRVSDILTMPSNWLKVEIRDNVPMIIGCEKLPDGLIEERQGSVFKMISETCRVKQIPNLILAYCTHDRPPFDGPFFTHARIKGSGTKAILSPCFTFDAYPQGPNSDLVSYSETFEKLVSIGGLKWRDRKDSVAFVGHIGDNNNRLYNTDLSFDSPVSLSLINQQASSSNFVSRESLNEYKFLLHLNGNNGAYASRFKYLLGAGSLVFYNYNSGDQTNFWEEWWMDSEFFRNGEHFVACENRKEFERSLDYFFSNESEAKEIALNGFNFFSENLKPDVVLEFWGSLLNEYSKRLIW